jgi:hypothetical protein
MRYDLFEARDHHFVERRHDLPLFKYLHERLPAADDLSTLAKGNDRVTDTNPAIKAAPLAFNFLDRGVA